MTRETKIGMVALFMLILAGTLGLILPSIPWLHRDTYEVNAVFDNARGIKENAQVLYAGVYIGRVHKIELKEGKAVLHLFINKKASIPEDAHFSIDSSGVIGDQYVKIEGGRPGSSALQQGMTVYEFKNDRMERLMGKAGKLLDTARSMQASIASYKEDP